MNHRHNSAILSLLCLTAPAFAQGEQDLKIITKKGASAWLLQESKQEQTIDMMGQEMESVQTTIHTLHLVVKDIDAEGNLIVETKIARIHGSMTLPMMGDSEFDSAKPAAADDEEGGMPGMPSIGTMTKALTQGAGKTFTVKVSPKGHVLANVSGVEEIAEGAESSRMGPGFDENTMHKLVEGAFGTLPEKAVAVGGTWKHEVKEAASRMPIQTNLELTLNKVDAVSFEVTSTGTVGRNAESGDDKSGDGDPMAEMMKGMKIKNGKVAGTQRVSREDGFVIEGKTVTSMDIEMESAMGSMSMVTKITTNTKRTTEADAMPKAAEKAEKTDGKTEAKQGKDKEAGK